MQGATLVGMNYDQAASNKTVNLDATQARALAAIINALPTASDAEHHCPMITSDTTVTFATTPKIVVTETICESGSTQARARNFRSQMGDLTDGSSAGGVGPVARLAAPSPESSAPPAATSAAPSPSIMHFLCTPPGWSPLTATPEELEKYGYPPRPSAGHDQAWVQAMKAAGTAVHLPGRRVLELATVAESGIRRRFLDEAASRRREPAASAGR